MSQNKIVRINDRSYDAVTGLPLPDEPSAPATKKAAVARQETAATSIHTSPQRSKTLHRRATKKPGPAKRPQPGTRMDISRSKTVSRFVSHPIPEAPKNDVPTKADAPAIIHPVAKKATQKAAPAKSVPATAKQIKDAAISKALAPAPNASKAVKQKKTRRLSWTRRRAIVVAILLFILSATAVTYFNLPTLSVAFASSQSGVSATYPKYIPDGYSLRQPVTFKDGEVALTFGSNGGGGEYTISQASSTWDSSAVRDNVVRKAVGENYTINQERGLTIYTYDTSAAWVNAGILYVITGNAPLSSDQLRRIATSL